MTSTARSLSPSLIAAPDGRHSPARNSASATPPPTASQPWKIGCRCIGFHSGRDSIFLSSNAKRISSHVAPNDCAACAASQPAEQVGSATQGSGMKVMCYRSATDSMPHYPTNCRSLGPRARPRRFSARQDAHKGLRLSGNEIPCFGLQVLRTQPSSPGNTR